jgi:hypothetical protein
MAERYFVSERVTVATGESYRFWDLEAKEFIDRVIPLGAPQFDKGSSLFEIPLEPETPASEVTIEIIPDPVKELVPPKKSSKSSKSTKTEVAIDG